MTPVFQQSLDMDRGDCFSACLASLLDVDLSDVPLFAEMEDRGEGDHMELAGQWLHLVHGMSLVEIHNGAKLEKADDHRLLFGTPGTLLIACYPAGTPDRSHAVVAQIDEAGEDLRVIHDPNPQRRTLPVRPISLVFIFRGVHG